MVIFLFKKILLIIIIMLCRITYAYAISATSAIVIDADSGRVLTEKNAQKKMGMASTTKIMTAIIALENASLDDIVTVSHNADNTEGSSMYLNAGEKIKMESLLYGLMLNSGNDAATAIAEHISGDTKGFAVLMNNKAEGLGLKNTSFSNPHGLDNEKHYSTAYDMAMLTKYCLNNDIFKTIVSTKNKAVEMNGRENSRYLKNHNRLLNMYEYCKGVKTGFTKKCGRCLVSYAEKDGVKLIAVTLNAPDDWNDHINMYEDAFSRYRSYKIIDKNSYVCSVNVDNSSNTDILPLYAKEDIDINLTEDEYKRIKLDYSYEKTADTPIYINQIMGKLTVMLDNKPIAYTDIISKCGIQCDIKISYLQNVKYLFTNLLSLFFKSV